MPALLDNTGRVIGAMDSHCGIPLHTRPGTAAERAARPGKRQRITFDGAVAPRRPAARDAFPLDGEPVGGAAKMSVEQAAAFLEHLQGTGKVGPGDMDEVMNLLVQAGRLDAETAAAALAVFKPGASESEPFDDAGNAMGPAMDAAYVSTVMARRRKQIAAGQRPASDLRLPIHRPVSGQAHDDAGIFAHRSDLGGGAYRVLAAPRPTQAEQRRSAADEADLLKRFPDMARLR